MSSGSLPQGFERGTVTSVHQGDCVTSADPDLTFSTILGSCIAACIRDTATGVGGMNHFLLAAQSSDARDRYGASARYGAYAMEQLINTVLKAGSGNRANLEIKIFGGGMISSALSDVGADNVKFVHDFLKTEGYRIVSEDTGGEFARRLLYKPVTGRAVVRRLERLEGDGIARTELALAQRAPRRITAGPEVELF